MDRSTPIYLVRETREQNAIGEWVSTEELRRVYANVSSVSASEYFNASQIGLNPEIRFTMFAPDYDTLHDGELIVELNGIRFSVYRIYRATTDKLELYAQRESGTATVTTTTTTTVTTTVTTGTVSENGNQS